MALVLRAVIGYISPDALHLAVLQAAKQANLSKEETERRIKSALSFREQNSIWPPGFM